MDHVLHWDEEKVTKWIALVGYSTFERQFKEQGITGDVLIHLDHESLRDLSVVTVGQRMDLLKNIYQLKLQHKIPVNEWDYIPPSALYETDWLGHNGMTDYRKIEAAFQERDARIKKLTEDMGKMNNDMNMLREEINLWKQKKDPKIIPNPTKPHKPQTSTLGEEKKLINDGGAIKVYGDKISKLEQEIESSKNVRLLIDDTTSKVICSALRKYNVASDWQQYALWIKYGTGENVQERALGYDERPLKISQKLKDAKQNPVFVLKSLKDNKPFSPPSYTHPRVPPPLPDKNSKGPTVGRVNYEVVVPVMASSVSSPTSTPTTLYHPNESTSSLATKKSFGSKLNATTPTLEYNNELGLDHAVVNAIFTINNSP
ncbi:hypothetical protein BY458DRAFT_438385 [Sporodiniella umbellata]|nr:hypothetical protein BY458DRAFT_438385 [Sporodiniella umbellata]